MNKTVSINLGGMFFHIDENAYQKLNRYFDAIRRSLSPDGKDEIMSDIEARIAELLSEKIKTDKQVVSLREIDEVIAVMGEPEDYKIDEETTGSTSGNFNNFGTTAGQTFEYYRTKKFFRDEDSAVIGGVCAGLAHYVRIEPLWIRIIFILTLIMSFGTTSLVYVILWILIPPALTTAEKLEMRGEPINISNIEKKVREEFNNVNDRLKNVDYDKLNTTFKSGADRVGSGVRSIIRAIGRVIGALLVFVGGIWLGGLLIALLITLFATTATAPFWYPYIELFNVTDAPIWLVAICTFFSVALPVLGMFLLGLRILIPHIRTVNSVVGSAMVMIWIASIAGCVYFGMRQGGSYSHDGKIITTHDLNISKNDTLKIRMRYNSYFANDAWDTDDVRPEQDSLGNDILYSNNISFFINKAEGKKAYLQIEKIASGNSKAEGRATAEKIKYGFKLDGSTLVLDNYLITDIANKWHDQNVEIHLYLPEGIKFKADSTLQHYDETDDNFFNLWFDNDRHVYEVGNSKVYCEDCIDENGEQKDSRWQDDNAVIGAPMTDAEMKALETETRETMKETAADLKEQAKQMKKDAEEMAKNAEDMAKEAKLP